MNYYFSDCVQNPNIQKTTAPISRIKYTLECMKIPELWVFNFDKDERFPRNQDVFTPSLIFIYAKKQRIYEPELEILKVLIIHLNSLYTDW